MCQVEGGGRRWLGRLAVDSNGAAVGKENQARGSRSRRAARAKGCAAASAFGADRRTSCSEEPSSGGSREAAQAGGRPADSVLCSSAPRARLSTSQPWLSLARLCSWLSCPVTHCVRGELLFQQPAPTRCITPSLGMGRASPRVPATQSPVLLRSGSAAWGSPVSHQRLIRRRRVRDCSAAGPHLQQGRESLCPRPAKPRLPPLSSVSQNQNHSQCAPEHVPSRLWSAGRPGTLQQAPEDPGRPWAVTS